jgi:hypothetical protein
VSGFEKIAEPWRELISFYRRASDARVKYRLLGDFLGEAQSAPSAVRPAVG